MILLRPVTIDDLDQIYDLAGQTKTGLTTLPQDRKLLEHKILDSVKTFQYPPEKPGGESFFFVLEDTENKKLVGTSAIFNKVGGFEPFWTYEIKTVLKESKAVNVKKEVQYLQLKADHNGPSEIGTLFLIPEYRKGNNGRLLSLSRFMFIAQFPQYFEDIILAELRGVISEDGKTIFWEAVGAHFFDIPFEKADFMVMQDKSFIDDLMPKHPIYIPLLPKEAQIILGEVHADTRPAIRLLFQENFEKIPEIDIFEAGPIVTCEKKNIRTVKDSLIKTVSKIHAVSPGRVYMVANSNGLENFRVTYSSLIIEGDDVQLPADVCKTLNISKGDSVRIVPIRKEEKR
ncbi:MAG: arginine N-succinyltransferase [Planctomycetota bacterium]|nr:MAG: arginine N-succinyltransferase [Planctomycetota bacterium]